MPLYYYDYYDDDTKRLISETFEKIDCYEKELHSLNQQSPEICIIVSQDVRKKIMGNVVCDRFIDTDVETYEERFCGYRICMLSDASYTNIMRPAEVYNGLSDNFGTDEMRYGLSDAIARRAAENRGGGRFYLPNYIITYNNIGMVFGVCSPYSWPTAIFRWENRMKSSANGDSVNLYPFQETAIRFKNGEYLTVESSEIKDEFGAGNTDELDEFLDSFAIT